MQTHMRDEESWPLAHSLIKPTRQIQIDQEEAGLASFFFFFFCRRCLGALTSDIIPDESRRDGAWRTTGVWGGDNKPDPLPEVKGSGARACQRSLRLDDGLSFRWNAAAVVQSRMDDVPRLRFVGLASLCPCAYDGWVSSTVLWMPLPCSGNIRGARRHRCQPRESVCSWNGFRCRTKVLIQGGPS
ncbi:hypothetical protein LZ32DRAFT_210121 [Colletotrichum eremochloae]|nr:hypothetical protein LZ32DRAFT_210121 [Colletotrichum eremochloae]